MIKPSLPPLALVAPISGSSTPIQPQFRTTSSSSYGDLTRSAGSAPNLQKINYPGDPNRRTDNAVSPLIAQNSGTSLESSNVCSQVTPTYHRTLESNQQDHHRYYSPPAGFPVPLPPPRLHPTRSKFAFSRGGGGALRGGSSPTTQFQPTYSQHSPQLNATNHNSSTANGGLHTAPHGFSFSSKEELLLDSDKYANRLGSSRDSAPSTGEHPPSTNFSESPSPGKETEGDTSSSSERCSSSNDGEDDVGSALSRNSKASGEHSDDSGQSNKSNELSNSAGSLSSGSKDSSSLLSLHRDSGNSSEDSTRANSAPGSGKFAPLSFSNNNDSSVSLLGSNGGGGGASSSHGSSFSASSKSNLRTLIDPQQSPIVEHQVEEAGEPEEDDGVKDEDESMEDEQDDTEEEKTNPNNGVAGSSPQPPPPLLSKKRKRRSHRKMSNVRAQHQVQNNATSQYFDNNRDKKYMSSLAPATKPQLPPISQILNSELYSSSDGLPPPPPHLVVSEDPLIRKVQNWKDY